MWDRKLSSQVCRSKGTIHKMLKELYPGILTTPGSNRDEKFLNFELML